jgi:phosphoglycolate phosphatase-like HAD superfamily hydrolase
MWFFGNGKTKALEDRIEKLQADCDKFFKERLEVKTELEDLKLKRKTEEEDIKHMVRMKEERMAVDLEKKTIELERQKDAAIAAVKDEYRDKLETQLTQRGDDLKTMYGQILERLPNITAKLTGTL